MTKKFRVGIVGCGFFSHNHLNAWATLRAEGVEIAAVCDLSQETATQAAKTFSVPRPYTDVSQMIAAEELDLIDIVTQVNSHQQLVDIALAAGVPTVVQKPFGPSLSACEAMLANSEARGVFLAVHENFRFQRPNRMISEILSSGQIGTPSWGRISFRTGYDIYAGQPYLRDEENFILTDIGVHVLDLARVFFGEVAYLSAKLQRRDETVRGDDTATIMLRHVSGAVSVVECTYSSHQKPDPFPNTLIEIEGTQGGLQLDGKLTLSVTSNGTLTTHSADPAVLDWAERPWHVVQESVLATCKHVLDRVRAGQAADISAADNIKTYALAEAAYRAAADGSSQKPPY